MLSKQTHELIALALAEDIGAGDITTAALVPKDKKAKAQFISRESQVVCGHDVVQAVLSKLDANLSYQIISKEGEEVKEGTQLSIVTGSLASILSAERVSLNFMQRMSGVATIARQLSNLVAPYGVRILDTRKTIPGFRELDKYAVKLGGASNHRIGLFDAILIKNNHIDAWGGSISDAIETSRLKSKPGTKIQVEVRDKLELNDALKALPDAILLDNMSPKELKECVEIVRAASGGATIELEASGGITPDNLVSYAQTGVDSISLGMLTHSVKASDISLRFME